MAATKGGTRERILDAAEQLFAESGYEGTSNRDIAALSGDTLGTLAHHFKTKDELHVAVIRRRYAELMDERARGLDARGADDRSLSLEELISSLVSPFLRRAMEGEPGWRNYLRLISRLIYSPKWYPEVVAGLYDPISHAFLDRLQAYFPEADRKAIGYAYHFVLGCMIHAASDLATNRLNALTGGDCDASNFPRVRDTLLRFCTAGVRAAVEEAPLPRSALI